jgi:hypothetical protein
MRNIDPGAVIFQSPSPPPLPPDLGDRKRGVQDPRASLVKNKKINEI